MRGPAIFPGSVCGLLLMSSAPVHAGTGSATLEVSLTVLPGCSVTAAPLTFVARAGEGADAEAPIEVRCSAETGVAVSLDGGRNASGGERRLASAAGAMVPYAIYADAARKRAWAGLPIVGDAAPNRPLRLMTYGRVERSDSNVPVGEYRDSVTVTVAF